MAYTNSLTHAWHAGLFSLLLRMNVQRKPGDWNCKYCQHLNFSRRDFCQKCRNPRSDLQFSDGHGTGGVLTSLDIRPGDWYCTCGYHNFASRSSCFNCSTIVRDVPAGQGAEGGRDSSTVRAGWKTGDWICTRWDLIVLFKTSSIDECNCMYVKKQWGAWMFSSLCLTACQLLPGLGATSTILLVGLSATGATLQGNQVY